MRWPLLLAFLFSAPSCFVVSLCGDGILNVDQEQCDDGDLEDGDGCSSDCLFEDFTLCGDGLLNSIEEQCDDGNTTSGDGCSAFCQFEFCGDGIVSFFEQCDEGFENSNTIPDRCRTDCTLPRCGDGVQDSNEQCDDGAANGSSGCSQLCQILSVCGDNILTSPPELCDDGNVNNGDGCSSSCQPESGGFCGDGIIQSGEECDDANQNAGDACTTVCAEAFCGDGFVQSGVEQCDDANNNDNDSCHNDCTSSTGQESCDGIDNNGNGQIDEGCDDDGDGFCELGVVLTAAAVGPGKVCRNESVGAGVGTDCNDNPAAQGAFIRPGGIPAANGGVAGEICDGIDNECAADGADEGCDDDGDDFCDSGMKVRTQAGIGGVAGLCPNTTTGTTGNGNTTFGSNGDDCQDAAAQGAFIRPGGIPAANGGVNGEICDGIDNECAADGADEGCNDDGDAFCDAANFVVNATSAGCPASANNAQGNDCNDAAGVGASFFPGAPERCGSGVEEDCGTVAGDSNGCDDDDDNFCDAANFVVNAVAGGCSSSANNAQGSDCNDANPNINPGTNTCP